MKSYLFFITVFWTDDQDGEGDHAETCATAYMVRVYDNLLRLNGKSLYGEKTELSLIKQFIK
jgi:hypothetical protein